MSQSKQFQFAASAVVLAIASAASAQTANVELAGQLGRIVEMRDGQLVEA